MIKFGQEILLSLAGTDRLTLIVSGAGERGVSLTRHMQTMFPSGGQQMRKRFGLSLMTCAQRCTTLLILLQYLSFLAFGSTGAEVLKAR